MKQVFYNTIKSQMKNYKQTFFFFFLKEYELLSSLIKENN